MHSRKHQCLIYQYKKQLNKTKIHMLTREDIYLFSHSTDSFLFNQAVTFKTVIQNEIADLVTPEEALYIVLPNFKINYNIIDKLINVAAKY